MMRKDSTKNFNNARKISLQNQIELQSELNQLQLSSELNQKDIDQMQQQLDDTMNELEVAEISHRTLK
jgi:hypothetical protein